eukprot:gnl/TRDRNA2_/TRDRNA2_159480_c0_seq3.p1 gnl/TRDRNA2_/TRDRNA2_159480_c0~~gnl/TRDRNA2_/TRDRNA2_159480_c0_seq3.p1  ORF type:complete len:532 (+),score=113.68 gnl/TRDRNA2_/TRDRNA2_159480_c0_seq3:85-1680(+)
MRCVIILWASALLALAAGARVARLRNPGKKTVAASGPLNFDLDLFDLKLQVANAVEAAVSRIENVSQEVTTWGSSLARATLHGEEYACLNCDANLFKLFLEQLRTMPKEQIAANNENGTVKANKTEGGDRHPNSPGYDKWAKAQKEKEKKKTNLLSTASVAEEVEVSVVPLNSYEIEAAEPRLRKLWNNRRLIVGWGPNPLHARMDFVESLVHLAHRSPLLTPKQCQKPCSPNATVPCHASPTCDALLSGRQTATGDELRRSLYTAFGESFIEEHRFNPSWNASEQKKHVQALLTKMKATYSFYYQKCLAHQPGAENCDLASKTDFLGFIRCGAKDNEASDDCVYAEERLCHDCGADGPRFFDYARFHGPLALFETKQNRHAVMGQCEEFSRAGHALLASLGYEARYVLDFTDHVWVEVRIPRGEHGEWLHADPSEGVFNNPLMYEKGWGKKLTMIFAFTPSKVEHVTAKYTDNYALTVMRRGIAENDLNMVLDEVNSRLMHELPITNWGHHSKESWSLKEVALWSHFEAN